MILGVLYWGDCDSYNLAIDPEAYSFTIYRVAHTRDTNSVSMVVNAMHDCFLLIHDMVPSKNKNTKSEVDFVLSKSPP